MKQKNRLILGFILFVVLAVFSMSTDNVVAQSRTNSSGDFSALIDQIITVVVVPLITLIWALSLLYFLWNAVKYLQSGMNDGDREEIRKSLGYSVLALFVMTAVWGLVRVIDNTLDLDSSVIETPKLLQYQR